MANPSLATHPAYGAIKLDDSQLPTYSILIPMYKEAATVPNIIKAMRSLDYPVHKLDIKLVIEEDDTQTLNAIIAQQPESYFDIIRVPYSYPRTKPKACNYALRFIRGDLVTIYDAEDRPAPKQLKQVVHYFQNNDPDTICVQARLNYYNRDENLLTRLFSLEYSSLFDFMLPALEHVKMPIPLGGTSNHINATKLKALGEWDPYNVTEDADLGIRLCTKGYKVHVIDSQTLEEAPVHISAWLNQRSRWIKGYMQTWLVYMRFPYKLLKQVGIKGFLGFQFFVGSPCFVYLLSPLMWSITLLWAMGVLPKDFLPQWLIIMSLSILVAGIALHIIQAYVIIIKERLAKYSLILIAYPFYWLLHSVASFKSLWQLLTRPHFWEKTTHGLSKMH